MDKLRGEPPVRISIDYTLGDVISLFADMTRFDREYMVTTRFSNNVMGVLNASGAIKARIGGADLGKTIENLLYYFKEPIVVNVEEPYEKKEEKALGAAKQYRSLFVKTTDGKPKGSFKDFISEIRPTEVLRILTERYLETSKKI